MIMCRWILLRMRNVSDKRCRDNQNTHIVFNIPFPWKSFLLWNKVEKYGAARQAADGNGIHHKCFEGCITKANVSQINPDDAIIPSLFRIICNTIIPSVPRPSSWSLTFRFVQLTFCTLSSPVPFLKYLNKSHPLKTLHSYYYALHRCNYSAYFDVIWFRAIYNR